MQVVPENSEPCRKIQVCVSQNDCEYIEVEVNEELYNVLDKMVKERYQFIVGVDVIIPHNVLMKYGISERMFKDAVKVYTESIKSFDKNDLHL